MAAVAPFVKAEAKWSANDFNAFLKALPPNAMLSLKKSLGLLDATAQKDQLNGPEEDAYEVQKYALRISANSWFYPFEDLTKLPYHDLATWVAKKAGVAPELIRSSSTFALEHELQRLLFVELWDNLTEEKRRDLLAKIDPHRTASERLALASLSGAAALAALSTTVALYGFAFYTSMSIAIAAAAGTVGFTLPFAAYTGASSLVGALSGPIGWAIMGAGTLGAIVLSGRPDIRQTASLIGQIHALKIEALVAAGVPAKDIFDATTRKQVRSKATP